MAFCRFCGEEIFDNIPHECQQQAQPQKPVKPVVPTNLNVNVDLTKARDAVMKLVQHLGLGDSSLDYFEMGRQIVPEAVELEEGEIPVKQYDHLVTMQSKLKVTRAHGRLQITNKRVLFRANGFSPAGKTTCQQIFDLDKLDGIEIRKDFRLRLCDTLFAFFLSMYVMALVNDITNALFSAPGLAPIMLTIALLSCVPFFLWKGKWLQKLLILSVGFAFAGTGTYDTPFSWFLYMDFDKLLNANISSLCNLLNILYIAALFLYSFKPNMYINFKASGGSSAIEIRRDFSIWRQNRDEYSGFAEVKPGKDADKAIREINTIINDIKTLGDLGIEKWKDK